MMHSSPGCKLAVVWAAREGLGWGSWHLHGGLPGWCKSWQTLASGLMGPPERPDWRPGLSPSDPSSWTHYSRPLTGAAGLVPTGTSGALSPRRPGGGKGVGSRGRLAAASLPPETISCRQHLHANPRVRAAGGRAVSLQACSHPLAASGPAEPGQLWAGLALWGWLPNGQGRPLPQTTSVQLAPPPPAAPQPLESVILRIRTLEAMAWPLGTVGPVCLELLLWRVWVRWLSVNARGQPAGEDISSVSLAPCTSRTLKPFHDE